MAKDFKTIDLKRYAIEVEGIVSGDKYKFRLRVFLQNREIISYPIDFVDTFIEDATSREKNLGYLELIVLRLVKSHLEEIISPPTYSKAFDNKLKHWFKDANREIKEEEKKE